MKSYKIQKEEVFKSQERKNEEQLKNNQKVCDEINVIRSQLKRASDELKSYKKQKEGILQKQNEISKKLEEINEEQLKSNEKIDKVVDEFNSHKMQNEKKNSATRKQA